MDVAYEIISESLKEEINLTITEKMKEKYNKSEIKNLAHQHNKRIKTRNNDADNVLISILFNIGLKKKKPGILMIQIRVTLIIGCRSG